MLAVVASLIDGSLSDAHEHHERLLKARPKPYVFDDATIARVERVNREGLELCDVYDEQLVRWGRLRLDDGQQREVARLEGVQRKLRALLTEIAGLADELGRGTIERQLAEERHGTRFGVPVAFDVAR